MRFNIYDEHSNLINTIIADLSFVEANYPGRYEVIVEPIINIPEIINTKYSKTDFKTLFFTLEELVSIKLAASTDPSVAVIEDILRDAEYVDLADPRTVYLLDMLEQKGILTANRVTQIISGIRINA